jgi:hypothetical protein
MAIERIPAWRPALHDAIEAHRRAPFRLGAERLRAVRGGLRAGDDGDRSRHGLSRLLQHAPEGAVAALQRAGFADLAALAGHFFGESPS